MGGADHAKDRGRVSVRPASQAKFRLANPGFPESAIRFRLMELIGNSPEETAYHEAGHIVIAAAVGLDLRPAGILMFEVRNLAAGIACYWEDGEVEPVLQALRAGQMAQIRQFPTSEIRGGMPDVRAFSTAVDQIYSPGHVGVMLEKTGGQVLELFDKHWGVVAKVAQALLKKDWASMEVTDEKYLSADERSVVRRKKQLTGSEIVEILEQHGISARVRSADSDARAS